MVWRYILAVLLSFVVLVAWQLLNPPPPPAPAPPPAARQAEAPQEGVPQAAQVPATKPVAEPQRPAIPPRERKEIPISIGPRFDYVADSKGACLSKVSLPEYHESIDSKDPYVLLRSPPNAAGTFSIEVEDPQNPAKPSRIPIEESWDLEKVDAGNGPPSVVFKYELDGISITKTVSVGEPELPGAEANDPDPRHLKLVLELLNHGTEAKDLTYRIYGPSGIDTEDLQASGNDIELASGTWGTGDAVTVEILPAGKITHKDLNTGTAAWVGVSNNYFTSIFFPIAGAGARRASFVEKAFADSYPDAQHMQELAKDKFGGRPIDQLNTQEMAQVREKAFKNLRTGFRSFKVTLAPGATPVRHEYGLYIGPRVKDALDHYTSLNFVGVNQYGTFGFFVKFFIWLLGVLRTAALGSWGLAIVLLTLLVKVCLHPLNRRTQGNMQRFQKKMQKIKPQMDEIKEKYAQNRLRMNQEIQKLWKEHHINPGQQMAGCLMMFIQLPIWIGLYQTLRYAIGLRQASFMYIADLTRPDKLFHLGFSLPLLGEWLNLLPVIYVILTIVNQRMQPKPDDPQMRQQYQMMTFMMVFFGYIFYAYPAGFMLYIMTSAALGIIESKIIKAVLRREDERGGSLVTANGGSGSGAMYPLRSRKTEDERAKRSLRS